jgi:hypothetical protein
VKIVFWVSLCLTVGGFSWATVRLVQSVRGRSWKKALPRLMLGFAGGGIALLFCIAVLLFAAFFYNSSRDLPPVYSPSRKHQAYVSSFDGGATEPWHTTVSAEGEVVYRSEADPEQVRLRWDGESHLVISTPSRPEQAPDPEYYWSPRESGFAVTCDTYPSSLLTTKTATPASK